MKPRNSYSVFVKSAQQLAKYRNRMHHVKDIFLRNEKLELVMDEPTRYNNVNRRTNVLIASQINSYSKMYIHRQFRRLQKDENVLKVISVNCDAFIVVRKKDSELPFKGLPEVWGNFRREYGNDVEIEEYYALNSRTYSVRLSNGLCLSKALGFDLTFKDCPLNFESFRQLCLEKMIGNDTEVSVKQKRLRGDQVKVSDFNFSSNIAKKRKIDISKTNIVSKPWGFIQTK